MACRLWKPDISVSWQGAGSYILALNSTEGKPQMAARTLEVDVDYVRHRLPSNKQHYLAASFVKQTTSQAFRGCIRLCQSTVTIYRFALL